MSSLPMHRRGLPRHGRRWRVSRIVIVLVVALILGEVINQIVNGNDAAGRLRAGSFVAAIEPLVDQSNALATTVHLVRDHAVTSDRPALQSALSALESGAGASVRNLALVGLPAPNRRSGALLMDVLAERRQASGLLLRGVSSAGGAGTPPAAAVSDLLAVGKAMLASDENYRRFIATLPRESRPGRLPSSRWIESPASWDERNIAKWAAALARDHGLAPDEALRLVAVSLSPAVVSIRLPTTTTTTTSTTTTSTTTTTTTVIGTATTVPPTTSVPAATTTVPATTTTLQVPPTGAVSVLPPTTHLVVVVVVENSGNVAVRDATVRGVLRQRCFARGCRPNSPRTTAAPVGLLAPGASVYLRLPALHAKNGASYVLDVSASIPGGPSIAVGFVVTVASNGTTTTRPASH